MVGTEKSWGYAAAIPEAKKSIGQRDPDDIELLALALNFKVTVWSNDKDFEDTGIRWLTTEDFLRQLALNDALQICLRLLDHRRYTQLWGHGQAFTERSAQRTIHTADRILRAGYPGE